MMRKSDAAMYAKEHPDSTKLLPNGKIHFIQTGMEFPANVETATLKAYAHGKAFRRAVERKINETYDFDQHVPYIVPHQFKDKKHFLYCRLTGCTLPRSKHVLVCHTNGRRFKRKFKEAEKERLEREKRQPNKKKGERQEKGEADKQLDEPMDDVAQEPGVLDGIVSSDEESADGSDAMEDEEEGGVLWTRGRDKAGRPADDDDEVFEDEHNDEAKGKVRPKQEKRQHVDVSKSENSLSLLDIKQKARKRQREKRKVQKKARRDRQRRRHDAMESS